MKIPDTYANNETLARAYRMGWNHGHGIACHNVPELGARLLTDSLGRVTVTADNVREVHESLCHEAASSSRDFSPFEFTAHELNSLEEGDEEAGVPSAEEAWEAFEQGVTDSIGADLSTYTDADYGIPEPAPEVLEYTLPAHWAPALINGDVSGLSDEEEAELNSFLEKEGRPSFVSCGDDEWFARSNDAGTLAGNVMTFQALMRKEAGA